MIGIGPDLMIGASPPFTCSLVGELTGPFIGMCRTRKPWGDGKDRRMPEHGVNANPTSRRAATPAPIRRQHRHVQHNGAAGDDERHCTLAYREAAI